MNWMESWLDIRSDDPVFLSHDGAKRFARRLTVKVVVVADVVNALVHLLLGAASLLPYPVADALVMGFLVTTVVSGVVGYIFCYQVGGAIVILARRKHLFKQLSKTDQLSGLANRTSFFEVLAADSKLGALLLIDIDRFKAVNDRFGHPVGDRVIIEVGQIIAGFASERSRAARLGGEEFGLIVDGSAMVRRSV